MRKTKMVQESDLDPWTLFLNAMRAPMTRDRYQTRVAKFFNFIGMPGKSLEEKARTFANKGKININWALGSILKFVYFQRERVYKKEISGATLRNYTKSIRLFCEMADIPIPWKKITPEAQQCLQYPSCIALSYIPSSLITCLQDSECTRTLTISTGTGMTTQLDLTKREFITEFNESKTDNLTQEPLTNNFSQMMNATNITSMADKISVPSRVNLTKDAVNSNLNTTII